MYNINQKKSYAERNIKKYIVVLTVDFENGCFHVPVEAESPEKAEEYATNKLCNEYPIYREHTRVYNTREVT